jgi:hypothetical protein
VLVAAEHGRDPVPGDAFALERDRPPREAVGGLTVSGTSDNDFCPFLLNREI